MKEAGYMIVLTFETNGGQKRVITVPPSKEHEAKRTAKKKDWYFINREVRVKPNKI